MLARNGCGSRLTCASMQVYLVGGAVRDELLGRPVAERDWVVVGATPEEMERLGFRPVGREFPVFLHPVTKEEYALARLERKTAAGYRGFATEFSPDVSLEQDLMRLLPKEKWILFSHQLIWHGRRVCIARKPRCMECNLERICYAKDKMI